MTMAPASLRTVNELAAIRTLLREAHALGARFRRSSALVEIDGLGRLPPLLQAELQTYADNGWLWVYLDGEEQDVPALELGDQLGVNVVLVETGLQARESVRTLIWDIQRHGGTLGIDIETAPQPGRGERPWAVINVDGTFSANQPEVTDRSALDPHLADICTLQLYAGIAPASSSAKRHCRWYCSRTGCAVSISSRTMPVSRSSFCSTIAGTISRPGIELLAGSISILWTSPQPRSPKGWAARMGSPSACCVARKA
jgi:hypothetical protein